MGFLEPRLSLKVQQKQILTPGLVQMVSLLTLNKLELIDQIQQELVQNPVLEEGTEIVEGHAGIAEHDIELKPNAAKCRTPGSGPGRKPLNQTMEMHSTPR
jgi:RNA polymerase sigma-54 factor